MTFYLWRLILPKGRTKQKNWEKHLFFVGILEATDKKRRIQIWIRMRIRNPVFTDPRIRNRIKMSRIRNTDFFIFCYLPLYGISFSPFVWFLFWSELFFFSSSLQNCWCAAAMPYGACMSIYQSVCQYYTVRVQACTIFIDFLSLHCTATPASKTPCFPA